MATITASSSASLVARACHVHNTRVGVSPSPVLGLPTMSTKKGSKIITCSMNKNQSTPQETIPKNKGVGASLLSATTLTVMSSPAMALVDERMSTEGTGLPFGLSNNLLGWILLGVFGLIWSLYFVYVGGLDEDEESGMSL